MLTNKKLLDEIIAQTSVNNDALREQLKQQILAGTSETSKSVLADITEKYEAGVTSIIEDFHQCNDVLKRQFNVDLAQHNNELKEVINREISDNQAEYKDLMSEYDKKLDVLREEINNRLDSISEEMMSMGKALSDSILNLQKDNSIIMESIHLILTNLLINGVSDK